MALKKRSNRLTRKQRKEYDKQRKKNYEYTISDKSSKSVYDAGLEAIENTRKSLRKSVNAHKSKGTSTLISNLGKVVKKNSKKNSKKKSVSSSTDKFKRDFLKSFLGK